LKRQAEQSRQRGSQQEQKQQEQKREHLKLLKHQCPPNENLRQEIAQLMAGKSKLEEELRQWEEIERQQDQQETAQQARDDTTKANKTEPQIQEVKIPMDDFLLQLQGLVEDMSISSARVQKGLSTVLKLVDESDQLREQLDQTISSTRNQEELECHYDKENKGCTPITPFTSPTVLQPELWSKVVSVTPSPCTSIEADALPRVEWPTAEHNEEDEERHIHDTDADDANVDDANVDDADVDDADADDADADADTDANVPDDHALPFDGPVASAKEENDGTQENSKNKRGKKLLHS
jgi:hypothetical protein